MDVDKYSTEGKTVIGDMPKLSRNPIQMKASIDNSIASTSSYFDESAMKELRNNLTECTDYNSYEDTDDSDDDDCRKPLLKGSWDVSRMEYFQLMQTRENGQSKSEEPKQIENIQLLHRNSPTDSEDVEVFIVEDDNIENLSLHSYKELKEKGSNIGYDELELHERYESIEAIENVVIDEKSEVSDLDEVNDTDESHNQSESRDVDTTKSTDSVVIEKESEQDLVQGKDDETTEESVEKSQDENNQDVSINNDKEIESSALVVMKMKEVNISTEEKNCDKNMPVSETKSSKGELEYEPKTNDNLYFKTLEKKLRKLHDQACKNLQGSKAEKALKSFEEILSHLISEYGPEHKRVATALHNLAIVHLRVGNYEDAIDAIEEAIKIRKLRLGKKHPKVSDSLVELGIILSEMEDYDESLEAFSEALILREKEMKETNESDQGKVKLQMAKILNNIGCAYFEVGELEDAAIAFEEALDIQQSCYEEGNFQFMPGFLATSCTLCNLGFVSMEGADYETAISHLEDALKLQRNILDANSFIIMSTLENLAYSYLQYGGLDKALKCYRNLFEVVKTSHHKYDLALTDTLRKKAYCEIKLLNFEEAGKTLEKIEFILENNLEPTDTEIEEIDNLISSVRVQIHKSSTIGSYISKKMTKQGYRHPLNSDLMCKCGYDIENDTDVDMKCVKPELPVYSTKMSGHKISFA